jgi:hypothetical protein
MDLTTIATFSTLDVFHVVVESPRGSALKLKYEPRWETMSITRPRAFEAAARRRRSAQRRSHAEDAEGRATQRRTAG